MSDLDQTMAALADPTRRAVVVLLSQRPWRSSELAAELEVTRPAMSRHLRVLRKARLVSEESLEDDARARVYHLERKSLTGMHRWLEEVEAFSDDQLEAFSAHAERTHRRRR